MQANVDKMVNLLSVPCKANQCLPWNLLMLGSLAHRGVHCVTHLSCHIFMCCYCGHAAGWSPAAAEIQVLVRLMHTLSHMGVKVVACQKVGAVADDGCDEMR